MSSLVWEETDPSRNELWVFEEPKADQKQENQRDGRLMERHGTQLFVLLAQSLPHFFWIF